MTCGRMDLSVQRQAGLAISRHPGKSEISNMPQALPRLGYVRQEHIEEGYTPKRIRP
jgi:hypothetical protein